MPVLLYSGNLGMGQDLGTVLRAVAQLSGQRDLYVRIVGGGKALPEFKKLSADLHLSQIEFCPPVPLYELPDLLASGDIHVVCQKPGTEGLLVPSKIYGILAAGRPVLFIGPQASEVGRIIQESGCGMVVQPGDIEQAKHALATLAGSAELREEMGQRAKACYDSQFGRHRSVSQIIELLEHICGNEHN